MQIFGREHKPSLSYEARSEVSPGSSTNPSDYFSFSAAACFSCFICCYEHVSIRVQSLSAYTSTTLHWNRWRNKSVDLENKLPVLGAHIRRKLRALIFSTCLLPTVSSSRNLFLSFSSSAVTWFLPSKLQQSSFTWPFCTASCFAFSLGYAIVYNFCSLVRHPNVSGEIRTDHGRLHFSNPNCPASVSLWQAYLQTLVMLAAVKIMSLWCSHRSNSSPLLQM